MNHNRMTRRRFVVAVIALSGAAGSALAPGLFESSLAWAASPGPIDEDVRRAMVRMARLLYPHDALPDQVYADVLDQALSDTAAGPAFAGQLEEAHAALAEFGDGGWEGLDASAQIAAMQALETKPYFAAIQNQVQAGIYDGPAFWKYVGYPGPSKDFGGYLHRGAGDIDWLPEDL